MSGICGILNLDGAPLDRELLGRMTASLAFRGPDGQGAWADGAVGLGHTLHRATDESRRERQPCTLDGRLWITADARVDARAELLGKLRGRTRAPLETATDPELLLHAYDAWGEGCLEHLLGDFAFAIWDADRRRLFCAVDHLGVKPLYWARVGEAFVFSNTLECVRLHPHVSDRLNETAIGDFLLFGSYQDRDVTVWADVPRLPPGHSLVAEPAGVRRTRYWSLPEVPEVRLAPRECVERFQELLDRAVADRLRTPRVAVYLSGGLDSPLVAAAARRVARRSGAPLAMEAFTVVFDHLIPDDERRFTSIAGEHLGIPVHFRPADDAGLYDWLDRPGWQPPEPVHDPTWGWGAELTREVAAAFPVAITGWDGDALLRATIRLHWLACLREGRLIDLARELAWYVSSQRALPPVGFRTALARLLGRTRQPPFPSWLAPGFVERARLRDRWRECGRAPREGSPRDAARIDLSSPLWTPLFDVHDAGWTGCALEARHPLMDLRVVTFAIGLPAVPWCVGKELLRRCLADLPSEIRSRPKAPLQGDPVTARLRAGGRLPPECQVPDPELARFVEPGTAPAPPPRGDVAETWAALRPVSLNCWLRSREGRPR